MAPKSQSSFPQLKLPTYYEGHVRNSLSWLRGKVSDDGAEGLWRVHDRLYNFTPFINAHPGGPDWLEMTKGTDITEAFETHHIKTYPQKLLETYYVRDATTPRNSPFTFREDGFYRTLKTKVQNKLKEIPPEVGVQSKLITDSLLAALLVFSPITCSARFGLIVSSIAFVITTMSICWLVISAHNFFHKKDNWRMYLFNFSLQSYRDWRVSHGLSHHLYTNTIQDVEIAMLEPFLQYFPRTDKPLWSQWAVLYAPVIYALGFLGTAFRRILVSIVSTHDEKFHADDLIGYTLPVWMWAWSGASPLYCLAVWLALMITSGFCFSFIGLSAGHHHPENFHDGDEPRNTELDWGLHQLDAVIDSSDIAGSLFWVLTHFGDHALHHFFPTLDHAYLPYLYPTLLEHCEKFNTEHRMSPQIDLIIGNHKQMGRTTINSFKYK